MENSYVVGVIFNESIDRVLCVLKNRPDFLKGTYNGVGGAVEPEDHNLFAAMVRETEEECGLVTEESDWTSIGRLVNGGRVVDFFVAKYVGSMDNAKSKTDEAVSWIPFQDSVYKMSPDMDWITLFGKRVLENPERVLTFYVE